MDITFFHLLHKQLLYFTSMIFQRIFRGFSGGGFFFSHSFGCTSSLPRQGPPWEALPATPHLPSNHPGAISRDGKEPQGLYTHPLSRHEGQLSLVPAKQEQAAALAFDSSHFPYGSSSQSPCHIWQEILGTLSLLRQGPPSGSYGRATLLQTFQYRSLAGPTLHYAS